MTLASAGAPQHPSWPATVAIVHALAVIAGLSWHFGGMDPSGRAFDAALCLPAPFVTGLAWRAADPALRRRFAVIVTPLLAITLLVVISVLNPSSYRVFADGELIGFAARVDYVRFLPSTIWPGHTGQEFAFTAALILIGLNVFLSHPSRGQVRALLAVVAVNAGVLACVGTWFKLANAPALLGAFPSSNPRFFATFFYHNHWGAFALLGLTAAVALAFHFRDRARDGWWRTPGPVLTVLALLLLVSLALSGARASLAAGLGFSVFAFAQVAFGDHRGRRAHGRHLMYAFSGIALASLSVAWVAQDHVRQLVRKTHGQIAEIRGGGIGELRINLYRDVVQLVREKPILGWGWASFPHAYRRVQTLDVRQHNEQEGITWFRDAHNDWLQLLTELGALGLALSVAALAGIFKSARARWWRCSPVVEILAGLLFLGLLALVDFPFACPAVVVTAWTLLLAATAVAHDRSRRNASP